MKVEPQKIHTLVNESDSIGVEREREHKEEFPYLVFISSHRAATEPCD
jgi:hypothetical protein